MTWKQSRVNAGDENVGSNFVEKCAHVMLHIVCHEYGWNVYKMVHIYGL